MNILGTSLKTLVSPFIHFYTIIRHPLTNVAIEISSLCNRRCVFCPNHTYKREAAFLDEELYHKIIDELKEIRFKGSLTFSQYNEPLLDKRLPVFIEYARARLPHAYIYLNTNGDFLDNQLWQKLRSAGLDFALVSQYDGKVNDNIQDILSNLGRGETKHIRVRVFDASVQADNRAGLVKQKDKAKLPLKKRCIRPFYQLQINYKGKAVLCCNDYMGSVEMGDMYHENIVEVWKNKKFQAYRRSLFLKDRASLDLCNKCDARFYLPTIRLPAFLRKIAGISSDE